MSPLDSVTRGGPPPSSDATTDGGRTHLERDKDIGLFFLADGTYVSVNVPSHCTKSTEDHGTSILQYGRWLQFMRGAQSAVTCRYNVQPIRLEYS